MMDEELFQFYAKQAKEPFSGWDFSYITETGRMDSEPLSWSYGSMVIKELRDVNSLLDMGTGGGEFLSMLRPLPAHTAATEGYEPNIPVARDRLKPFGIDVKRVEEDDILPFEDGEFNLVINRHESFSASEVKRVLSPGGTFITQQVGGLDLQGLNLSLCAIEEFGYAHWNMDYAREQLKKEGFLEIEGAEEFPITRFFDIGAIIYYLKAIPWQIEDFTVEKYRKPLMEIHDEIERRGYIDFKSHRFYLTAKRP
ncbi:class I SAM-dependent methyltransferase [Falsibacillus pallidus]|uniref:class I SAM-dependent methyltransferase n=1 Tax=Falsibacillus pallidus TaxID=493781 RepID=UPI003D97A651